MTYVAQNSTKMRLLCSRSVTGLLAGLCQHKAFQVFPGSRKQTMSITSLAALGLSHAARPAVSSVEQELLSLSQRLKWWKTIGMGSSLEITLNQSRLLSLFRTSGTLNKRKTEDTICFEFLQDYWLIVWYDKIIVWYDSSWNTEICV